MTDLPSPENAEAHITEDGRVVIEPGYLGYIREHGFTIESLEECHAVPSESDTDKSYVVQKVVTYEYPRDHPKLDVAEHTHELWVCSCWAYRSNTNDVGEKEYPPDGSCKHILKVAREKRAKADESQETL